MTATKQKTHARARSEARAATFADGIEICDRILARGYRELAEHYEGRVRRAARDRRARRR